ncbi:hypothetical protein BDA99DRAFT_602292 [Phascolomyces articulosus]|uniref:Fungal lipase-type domain-containing protein n=1 Tax=Phascolomyces articulosus TaxID=60185 RepID=A0AAD5KJC1_9FUNG|nr:hypothetical protein BDA99DRAFT_602292 [Phascolomyces articulosus]
MAPTSALPIPNPPMPSSTPWTPHMDKNRPMSPSRRLKRSMRGVRNFFRHSDPKELVGNNSDNGHQNQHHHQQQQTPTNNQQQGGSMSSVAVTLSADIELAQQENNMDLIMTTSNHHHHSKIQFLPFHPQYHHYNHHQHHHPYSKAYVHYEPNQGLVAVGNHPDTKHAKTLWLTLEQYAWMIRQLHQEQYIYGVLRDISNHQNNPLSIPTSTSSAAWSTTSPSPLPPPQQHDDPRIASLIGIVISKEDGNGSTTTTKPTNYQEQQRQEEEEQKEDNAAQHHHTATSHIRHSMNNITSTHTFNTITKRFSRIIQRANKLNQHYQQYYFNHFHPHSYHHRTCLLLPKSLLLHAAAYIPMTKALSPPFQPQAQQQQHDPTTPTTIQQQQQDHPFMEAGSPFQPIPAPLSIRLRRYVQLAALCMHDLSLESASGLLLCRTCSSSSTRQKMIRLTSIPNSTTHDISIIPNQQQQQPTIQITRGNDVTFPMTYLHTSIEQRRRTFDSYQYSSSSPFYSSSLSPHHSPSSPTFSSSTGIGTDLLRRSNSHKSHRSSMGTPSQIQEEEESIPTTTASQKQRPRACSAIVTDSVMDPFDSSVLESLTDKRGYVAMDDENQEIIVTFPGIPASGFLFENTSLTPVPWHESLDEMNPQDERESSSQPSNSHHHHHQQESGGTTNTKRKGREQEAYVLECAVAAWRRCELTVATSLMRMCRVAPEDYRVVIIGHSLGGAVAALCASSLVTTGLLVDRPVTLCTIDSPRVGSDSFVEHLTERVETIRITHVSDIWSQMPPRTSGLLHVGSTTVTVMEHEGKNGEKNKGSITQQENNKDGYLLQGNDLNWIEDTLADNTHVFSSSSLSHGQEEDEDELLVTNGSSTHSSLWGIPLYSTPCQKQPHRSSSRYDEKHLSIV